jgi:hypothetical protein
VDVYDGGTSARRRDSGGGNLLRETGQWGLLVTLVSSPVMAQVMMTSEFIEAPRRERAT